MTTTPENPLLATLEATLTVPGAVALARTPARDRVPMLEPLIGQHVIVWIKSMYVDPWVMFGELVTACPMDHGTTKAVLVLRKTPSLGGDTVAYALAQVACVLPMTAYRAARNAA